MRRAMTAVLGGALLAACGGGGGGGDGDDDGPIEVSAITATPTASADSDGQRCDITATVRNIGDRTCQFVRVTFFALSPEDPTLRIGDTVDSFDNVAPGEARTFSSIMFLDAGPPTEFPRCDEFILDNRFEVASSTDC
jgi:hypothetical protein